MGRGHIARCFEADKPVKRSQDIIPETLETFDKPRSPLDSRIFPKYLELLFQKVQSPVLSSRGRLREHGTLIEPTVRHAHPL